MTKHLMLAGATALAFASAAFAADQTTTVNSDQTVTTTQVIAAPSAGDVHTLNNNGVIRGSNAAIITNLALTGSGSGRVVINNNGRISGVIDFSALSGGVTFNNNTGPNAATDGWHFQGGTGVIFGAGNDTLNNTATGSIGVGVTGTNPTMVDFGGGADLFDNAGLLVVGRTGANGNLTLVSLETFDNSGLIVLGAAYNASGSAYPPGSAGNVTDRLIAAGVDFVASGDSRIALDARLGGVHQSSCITVGALEADCVNFAGGSTSGVTRLIVRGVQSAAGGAYNPGGVVLVDVSGGESHAGDFVIDPDSPNYVADGVLGAAILAANGAPYSLLYDATTQTHRLVGLPHTEVLQLGALASAAQELWRIGDEAGYARQAELRGAESGGGWAKITGGTAERETASTLTAYGQSGAAPVRYEQKAAAAVFGADIVGEDYVLGVSAGHIRSRIEVGTSVTEYELRGLAVSLYGGYRVGDLYVDASASGYAGKMKAPAALQVGAVEGDASAFGGRVEAAWRLPVGRFTFEPLAGAVYVQSSLSDIALPGDKVNALDFGKGKSLRGGLGARAAYAADLGGMTLDLSLTGRGWKEFQGENPATLIGRGGQMGLMEEFSGDFGEVLVAAAVTALDGLVSGFASVGGRFGDDYDATSATLGVRYNW